MAPKTKRHRTWEWLAARHLLSALTVGFVIQAPIPKYFSWKFPTDANAGNYQKPKRKSENTQFLLESKNGVMFARMFLKGASQLVFRNLRLIVYELMV